MRLNGKLAVLPLEDVRAKKPSILQKLNDIKSAEKPHAAKKSHTREER